jgi:hypothetical protein
MMLTNANIDGMLTLIPHGSVYVLTLSEPEFPVSRERIDRAELFVQESGRSEDK